jgi:hypothetical protein
MKILRAVAIIISIYFLSCNKENSFVSPFLTAEFFPLQVGNKWVYNCSLDSSEWSFEITRTKIIGEHVYFEQVRNYSGGNKDTNYFRIAENNVVLIYFEGEDHIYVDFEKPLNEVWNSYASFYGYIRQRNISDDVEAGRFSGVTEVFIDNRSISDVYEFSRYASDVGMISSSKFRFELSLKQALVNGVSFP